MSVCPDCGGPLTDDRKWHWDGCQYLRPPATSSPVHRLRVPMYRSAPPRIILQRTLRSQPSRTTDRWPCYACGENLCDRWVTASFHVEDTRWPLAVLPLCDGCNALKDPVLQAIIDQGAQEGHYGGQVAWAATRLTAEEATLYQPIADAVRHWDNARFNQPITEVLPVTMRGGVWGNPGITIT